MAGAAHAGVVGEEIDPDVGKDRDQGAEAADREERSDARGPGHAPGAGDASGTDRHADHRYRGDAERERNRRQQEFKPRADAVAGEDFGTEARQQMGEDADGEYRL